MSLIQQMLLLLSLMVEVHGGVLDHCHENYTVKRTHSLKETTITVRNAQRVCDRLTRDKKFELVSNDDLLPKRSLIRRNGKYFLKFTWRSSVYDGFYPKKFLLLFESTLPEQNITRQSECVILRLGKRKADKSEIHLFNIKRPRAKNYFSIKLDYSLSTTQDVTRYSYFSFQCIKLVDDPQEKAGNVSLQILNYSHRTYNADCGRLKRSVDHLNSCQKIECSEKRHHSLSLDRYKTEICSCYASLYGTPKLEIDYIHGHNSIAFNMTISNLPDFIALLNVTICRDGVEVWYEDKFIITNGTVRFITQGFKPVAGNYSVKIFRLCIDNNKYKDRSSKCLLRDSYTNPVDMEMLPPPPPAKETFETNSLKIVGFLSLILFTSSITMVVFVLCRRRNRQQTSRSGGGSELNNLTESGESIPSEMHQLLPHWEQGRKLLVYHPEGLPSPLQYVLSELRDNLLDGRQQNWRQFASDAVMKYHDVVILVSEGLLELLCGVESVKEARLVERQCENVPTVVMDSLKVLVSSYPERQDFFLHFVSTKCDKGKSLISKFFETYRFLKLTRNYCVYFLENSLPIAPGQDEELTKLINRLKPLGLQTAETEFM